MLRGALALSLLLVSIDLRGDEFRAGVAVEEITPPVGWRMANDYKENLSTGIHDPLLAKALYFRQGDTEMALVICDLTGVPRFFTDRARRTIEKKAGIPAANVVVAATHTHGAPLFYDARRDHFHRRAIAKHRADKAEPIDYPALLVERCAKAAERAKKSAVPARLQAGITQVKGLAFNRRYHMKNGTVVFNPGKKNPNIIRPAGPTDPRFHMLLLRDAKDDKTIGSLSVFAMHTATFGGTRFGADFPMHLEKRLRERLGKQLVSVFGEGTAGDVNHIDVSSDKPQTSDAEPPRIGRLLGDAFLSALPGLKSLHKPSLAVRSTVVKVPIYEVTDEQIRRAEELLARDDFNWLDFLLVADANRVLDVRDARKQYGSAWPMEVQAARLDAETALVMLPHEVFVELGLAIKNSSPFKNTFVLSLCNDIDFYLPTKRSAEGSYEVVTTRVKPGAGEKLVEASVELLKALSEDR